MPLPLALVEFVGLSARKGSNNLKISAHLNNISTQSGVVAAPAKSARIGPTATPRARGPALVGSPAMLALKTATRTLSMDARPTCGSMLPTAVLATRHAPPHRAAPTLLACATLALQTATATLSMDARPTCGSMVSTAVLATRHAPPHRAAPTPLACATLALATATETLPMDARPTCART